MVLGGPDMAPALLALPDAGAPDGLTQYLWNKRPRAFMRQLDSPSKGAVPMVSLGAAEQISGGGLLLLDSR